MTDQTVQFFINLILQDYLKSKVSELGEKFIESNLRKKFQVSDANQLSDSQKFEFLLFLYDTSKGMYGSDVAKEAFEKSVKNATSRQGVTRTYYQLLDVLPREILESERSSISENPDLEDKIKERTKELEDAKQELEKRVHERTEELESEKNKFKLVLYNTADGIFALDRQNRIVSFNKAMEDMTGYAEKEVLGNYVDEYIRMVDKEGVNVNSAIYCPQVRALQDRSVYKSEDLTLKSRHKNEFHIKLNSSVIAENSDTNIGCIVTIHDITQQKELERMKLDFVSIAAHELRTPLTSIRGYLSLVLESAKTKLSSEELTFLERVYLSSNQLFALVENLLNVSKIERGSVHLSTEQVDWSPFVSQLVQSFEGLADERKIKLTYVPLAVPSRVLVDPLMIGEVVSNLLDNALRYTPEGGSVLVFLEPNDKFIVTHIKDTGQGIPKESLSHLFTKFYRVSGVLEQGSKGTGLGLYISKELVKLHGGDIWAESELGQGSTFSFSVPKVLK